MNLGQWLKSLSTGDHIILLIFYAFCVYLSKASLENLIKIYDKKKEYSEFRIRFRITPIMLLSLGFLYSYILYNIFKGIFVFMP
ncbi:MAG: hypothetical protein CMF94_01785 [Candidatus Marinimicrobia bacterium]|nr:hypothetical protein [Candidatus Neomarinimicrobiota bacterium]|tara:strand:+ start:186 stop:437 length:252 start_codon:yes stop_codon:yes gene_type:complete